MTQLRLLAMFLLLSAACGGPTREPAAPAAPASEVTNTAPADEPPVDPVGDYIECLARGDQDCGPAPDFSGPVTVSFAPSGVPACDAYHAALLRSIRCDEHDPDEAEREACRQAVALAADDNAAASCP